MKVLIDPFTDIRSIPTTTQQGDKWIGSTISYIVYSIVRMNRGLEGSDIPGFLYRTPEWRSAKSS